MDTVLAVEGSAINVRSVVDRVYDLVCERITSGELPRGSRLRQETLARELGVSRTPLREALRRLASEGLVVIEPNRGAHVASVSFTDMLAAYEARLVLEPGAARLAAQRADPADAEGLRAALDAQRRSSDHAASFAASRAFHLALVRAAANEHLTRLAEQLWVTRLGAVIYARQHATDDARADADQHEQILAAVVRGDADAAEALTRRHIAQALAGFAEHGAG